MLQLVILFVISDTYLFILLLLLFIYYNNSVKIYVYVYVIFINVKACVICYNIGEDSGKNQYNGRS